MIPKFPFPRKQDDIMLPWRPPLAVLDQSSHFPHPTPTRLLGKSMPSRVLLLISTPTGLLNPMMLRHNLLDWGSPTLRRPLPQAC